MKKNIIGMVVLFAFTFCEKDDSNPKSKQVLKETRATIADYYALDGCSFHIIINDSVYITDTISRNKALAFLKDSITNGYFSSTVTLGYYETPYKDKLICGWNTYSTKPLIKISYLKPNN